MQTHHTSFDPITSFGSLGGSQHTTHDELKGGRTAITTEALKAYNNLRAFQQLESVAIEDVGRWAFANQLTNNATPTGNDLAGVGLWYAMQGAKVGWIADQRFDPAVVADLQRSARLGTTHQVLKLAQAVAQPGFIDHLKATNGIEAFVNTLKMEPHHGGWMHSRAHGVRTIEGGARAHDVNHLTVLSHDQTQPFMNDTFDWPQWPALEVPHGVVIDYFQSMVTLSDPLTGESADPASVQPEAPPAELAPIPTPDSSDSSEQAELEATINGSIWWKGFTADITLTNTSRRTLKNWNWSFDSPHTIGGDPWGAHISSKALPNGEQRHTLTGSDWGTRIRPGESITVGFNGSQRVDIGDNGSLSADLLFGGSAPNATAPQPKTEPAPEPIGTPDPEPAKDASVQPTPADEPNQDKAGPLQASINGSIWWKGFTADITLTNTSRRTLKNWNWSFDSPHTIGGDPWGAHISSKALPNGEQRHTLTGSDWGTRIRPGESITVGFNGSQRVDIGDNGSLSADLLFGGSAPNATAPQPKTEPAPEPTTMPVPKEIDPGPAARADYGQALDLSLLFYEANRSGDLDESINRVSWRGDSGLRDGLDGVYFGDATANNRQDNLQLDLTGGYHDAGDHVKFGLPLASTLSTLAWGGISFSEGFEQTNQLDDLLKTVRWGTDYLLKAHGINNRGDTTYFIAQVGDGNADHALWSAPETQTIPRPAMAVTADKPGSDVAAASAAAMAAASVLFEQNGQNSYAETLYNHATSLFEFADRHRGKYSDSIPAAQSFYNSWSGYHDELAYGAAWLGRASEAQGRNGDSYWSKASQLYHQNLGGLNNGWTHNWDDASYATAMMLANHNEDGQARADVRDWLDSWVDGTNGVEITAGGLRYIDQWGALRYAANTAMLSGIAADSITDPGNRYKTLAKDTVDYILGANPRGSSYMVGYGENFPKQPHHRAASGIGWSEFNSDQPNRYVLDGALVGGPSAPDDWAYQDIRSDYISNEVAIDYNAGLTGALAFLNQT